jgi:hypothetical protein
MEEQNIISKLKSITLIIGGNIAIFTSLLWLMGHEYSVGYFDAMNIPQYYVQFSLLEYGRESWTFLFIFLIIVIALSVLLFLSLKKILKFTIEAFYPLVTFIKRKFIRNKNNKFTDDDSKEIKNKKAFTINFFISLFFALAIVLILNQGLIIIKSQGSQNGKDVVLQRSPEITLVSNTSFDLDKISKKPSDDSNVHVYGKYRLLSVNNGYYFVFNQIDKKTCKPKDVYILDEEKIIQTSLRESVKLECDQ